MKIGNLILFNSLETIEEKFKIQNNSGFGSCQLCCWNIEFFTEENARLINSLKEKYEIEISALWCGWSGPAVWNFYDGPKTLGLLPEEYRETRVKELLKGCDFAEMIGVTDIATHMGFILGNPNDPQKIVTYKDGREYWGYQHAVQIDRFYRSLAGEFPLEISGEETLKIQKIICDIYKNNDCKI